MKDNLDMEMMRESKEKGEIKYCTTKTSES